MIYVYWLIIILLAAAWLFGLFTVTRRWNERTAFGQWWRGVALTVAGLAIFNAAVFAATGLQPLRTAPGMIVDVLALTVGLIIALIALLRWLMSPRWRPLAVARAVLDEVVATRVVVGLIAIIMLIVIALPFRLADDTKPVRYIVQSYLGWSLTITAGLLSIMTLLLACWTLSSEIRDKQIFTVAVKPIGRGAYLIGKWLGLIAVNAVLITVAGAAIYLFTVGYLAELPPRDAVDTGALENEVLTARVALQPEPYPPIESRVRAKLDAMSRDEFREIGLEEAANLRLGSVSEARLLELGRNRAVEIYADLYFKQWRTVAPNETVGFLFHGLGPARDDDQMLQFRYNLRATKNPDEKKITVTVVVNGRPTYVELVPGSVSSFNIPAELVDEKGDLLVQVRNSVVMIDPQRNRYIDMPGRDSEITFAKKSGVEAAEGVEILYTADHFGMNFTRGLIAIWIKLAFIAMLGLAAATFLGFPVAVLAAMMIFIAAASSEFLADSVSRFGGKSEGVEYFVNQALGAIGFALAYTLQQYSAYQPTPLLVDGQLFAWSALARCLLWIGLVWTGLAATIGYLIFRRRELARVQV